MMKKLFALLVLLTALAAVMPAAMAAEDAPQPPEFQPEVQLIRLGCPDAPRTVPGGGVALFALTKNQEQQLYNTILAGLEARAAAIDISQFGLMVDANWKGEDRDLLSKVFWKVCNDNPQLIYVVSTSYSGSWGDSSYSTIRITTLKPVYDEFYDDEKIAELNAVADEAMARLDEDMTDLEKALVLHDFVAERCAYDWQTATTGKRPHDRVGDAYGALVEGNAVCQGYTMAYKLLLNRVGIVSTTATGVNHIWNVLCLDGEWYHVDVTWDDPTPDRPGRARYDYFLIPDHAFQEISPGDSNHVNWEEDVPVCTSEKYRSGWAFNGAAVYLYRKDGGFYYVKGYALFHGDLAMTKQEQVAALGGYNCSNGIWLENELYFVDWRSTTRIVRCDLTTGEVQQVGSSITYVRTASPDGYYSSIYDVPCLRLDSTGTALEIYSNTRRTAVYSVKLPEFPIHWEKAVLNSGESVKVVGVERNGEDFRAGILAADSQIGETFTVLAAVYQSGRMIQLRQVSVTVDASGLMAVDLGEAVPEGCTFCLMMTQTDWIPVCAAYRPDAV